MIHSDSYRIVVEIYATPRTLVYRGTRLADGLPVIVKTLVPTRRDAVERARLQYELSIVQELALPGICQGLELLPGAHGVVFADIGGESLQEVLRRGPLPIADVLEIGLALAHTLAEIHRRGIVHKDISPGNIVRQPQTGQVQLIDFGIASRLPRETQAPRPPHALEGTLAFMAPEQTGRLNRSVDLRSDLFGLGATLYALCTGQPPQHGADLPGMIHAMLAEAPRPPSSLRPEVPDALEAILLKLLAKEPDARYQSAFGLAHDLQHCLAVYRATGQAATMPLGTADRSEMFIIPERLYGREADIRALVACFDKARAGRSGIVFVAGPSAVGKSALVRELRQPIAKVGGLLAMGKYDMVTRDVPYSGLRDALTTVIKHILAQPASELARWRQRVQDAVGDLGELAIRAVPATELLIGKQPTAPDVPAIEEQQRFRFLMQRFIRGLAHHDAPLVLFLDDLQWADSGTLNLLMPLAADREASGLLVVGAYRDNEVAAAHPLAQVRDELRRKGWLEHELATTPMDLPSIAEMVRDTTRCPAAAAHGLAELLAQKTGGLAFFVRELLAHLRAQDLLRYEPAQHAWVWNMADLAQAQLNASVAELLSARLRDLPAPTRRALSTAAHLGARFDLQSLAALSGMPPAALARDLAPALAGAVLVATSAETRYSAFASLDDDDVGAVEGHYRFAHDRLQEACYALTAADAHAALHLRVGQLLLARYRGAPEPMLLMQTLEHMNRGHALVTDSAARSELGALNLEGGYKARAAAAYAPAAQYFRLGTTLLPNDDGRQHDALLRLAECEFLLGNFDAALAHLDVAAPRAPTGLASARLEQLRQVIFTSRGELLASRQACIRGLPILASSLAPGLRSGVSPS